jgi:hypothetical protein
MLGVRKIGVAERRLVVVQSAARSASSSRFYRKHRRPWCIKLPVKFMLSAPATVCGTRRSTQTGPVASLRQRRSSLWTRCSFLRTERSFLWNGRSFLRTELSFLRNERSFLWNARSFLWNGWSFLWNEQSFVWINRIGRRDRSIRSRDILVAREKAGPMGKELRASHRLHFRRTFSFFGRDRDVPITTLRPRLFSTARSWLS